MTAFEAFFPPAFTAAVGIPVLLLTGWTSGWVGLILAIGLLVVGHMIVWAVEERRAA